jgi:hypothetical protein
MKLRRITSLTMFISLVPLLLTSVVLYIVPEGRVAYWSDWKMLGLTKSQWGDVHINLGWLFLAAGLLHIMYNWKVVLAYLKNRARELKVFTPEFNISLLLTVVFVVGTLFLIPPFSTILDFGRSFKDAAAVKYGEPPYGHAELSSLKTLSRRTGLDLQKMLAEMNQSGIQFTGPDQTVLEIARGNGVSPKDVYAVMEKAQQQLPGGEQPAFPDEPFPGFGKLLLVDLCEQYGLDLEMVKETFSQKGLTVDGEKSLRDIAAENGTDPHALFEVLHQAAGKS